MLWVRATCKQSRTLQQRRVGLRFVRNLQMQHVLQARFWRETASLAASTSSVTPRLVSAVGPAARAGHHVGWQQWRLEQQLRQPAGGPQQQVLGLGLETRLLLTALVAEGHGCVVLKWTTWYQASPAGATLDI